MLKKDPERVIAEVQAVMWNTYMPSENIGWPPQMVQYIQTLMNEVIRSLVYNIFRRRTDGES